jgi:hypothetical protein
MWMWIFPCDGFWNRSKYYRAFALHELPSPIGTIFSSKDESDAIRCSLGNDAQLVCVVVLMNVIDVRQCITRSNASKRILLSLIGK